MIASFSIDTMIDHHKKKNIQPLWQAGNAENINVFVQKLSSHANFWNLLALQETSRKGAW